MDPKPAFVDCYGHLAERLTPEMTHTVPDLTVWYSQPENEDELIDRLAGRRHVLVYMAYMSERVLRASPCLKSIAYLSSGLATHGDLDSADALGIRFEGVRGYGDRAVAEHAVTLALSGLKRIAEMDRSVRSGSFELTRTAEFAGKTFGVLGLGGIGREVARIAHALGANVIAWTPSGMLRNTPVDLVSMDTVFKRADIVSLHLSLTPESHGIVGSSQFAQCKPGMILVNTARGQLVDEAALLDALESGKVGHAALDVFACEPLPVDHPFCSIRNVTLTPHSAWLTTEAIDRLLEAGLALLHRHVIEAQ